MAGSWVNVVPGVPVIGNFGSTSGQGTPICINAVDGAAYYANKGAVIRVGVGPGGLPTAAEAMAAAIAAQAAADAAQATANAAVRAMYGQIKDNTSRAQTISAGWTPLLNYDTQVAAPIGVTQNAANGTLALTGPGVYVLNYGIDITYTSNNAGRNTNLRLFNVTDNAVMADVTVGIGRDTDAGSVSGALLFTAAVGNKVCRLEVGGGDALTGVTRKGCSFGVHRISA